MAIDVALRIPPRPEMVLGAGALEDLAELVGRLGTNSAFVVTDRGLVAAGVAGKVVGHLESAGVRTGIFDGVGPNPCARDVLAGSAALRSFGDAAVVAVGGGSAMDAAKAVALHAVNDRPLEELDHRTRGLTPAAPLIGVPTTAGTGAETNAFGVIDDPIARRKRYIGDSSALPRFALLDPNLSVTAPPRVTAACGIDVLAHAMESVQARECNVYSAALGLEAIRLVVTHLPAVVVDGRDVAGRSAMLLAAHLAGLAFATTGLGTAHAIGHALSARYGTAHGIALAAVLPLVVGFNARERVAETVRIAEAAGVTGGAGGVQQAVSALQEGMGLRPNLRELGVLHSELPAIADAALVDEVVRNAPRVPTRIELVRMLDAAY
ncbi:MAG: iron-containing alcohol dehydrogenase [Solirubrobacterales bacterium]|nr:iron-containing alcohol dehydrogenase [Solirubrobacterales bacterium]